jgi:hypothetical protein
MDILSGDLLITYDQTNQPPCNITTNLYITRFMLSLQRAINEWWGVDMGFGSIDRPQLTSFAIYLTRGRRVFIDRMNHQQSIRYTSALKLGWMGTSERR